jgi:hypothetical protein
VAQVTSGGSSTLYAAGSYQGTLSYHEDQGEDTSQTSYDGSQDAFVYKLATTSGGVAWVKSLGGSLAEAAAAVATDSAASPACYVAGAFASTDFAPLGGNSLSHQGSSDVFVVKLSSGGSAQWALAIGGAAAEVAYDVEVTSSGTGVIVAGTFTSDTLTVGDTTLTNAGAGEADTFIAELAADTGAVTWAARLGGAGSDVAYDVAVDASDGSIYLAGAFSSPYLTLGGTTLVNQDPDLTTGFVAKFNSTGGGVWLVGFAGGNGAAAVRYLLLDGGFLYVTGNFASSVTIGGDTLTSVGGKDAFFAKLDGDGNVYLASRWVRSKSTRWLPIYTRSFVSPSRPAMSPGFVPPD